MSDQTNNAPMELLYIWINCDETEFIRQQGFNLSPIYQFTTTQKGNDQYELSCEGPIDHRNVWETNTIMNLTAVVGENGTGKSSLLRHIVNASILPIKKEDRFSETINHDDSYEYAKMVLIYRCGTEIKVLHNFKKNELSIVNKEFVEISIEENYSAAEALLENQTTIYLSNAFSSSRSVWESEWGQNPIIFSPAGNYDRADLFFRKVCGLNWVNKQSLYSNESVQLCEYKQTTPANSSLNSKNKVLRAFCYLQENIASHKNYRDFERLCTVSYYHHLHSKESSSTQLVSNHKDLIVGLANFYTLTNQSTNKKSAYYHTRFLDLLTMIQDDFRGFYRQTSGEATIGEVLNYYLSLENSYLKNLNPLISINEIEEYYRESASQIEKLISVLSDNSVEPVYRNRRVAKCIRLKYGSEAYKQFCEFIDKQMKDDFSFVLKYLTIEIPPMSSGEQALQNIFSWLRLPPYFDKLFDEESITLKDNILLLLDEVDLYMHPEWQRQFLDALSKRLEAEYSDKHIQVIISTHSPLVLSDIPLRNTLYLDKTGDKCTVVDRSNTQESFGANLYSLLRDSFFLKKTTGEFSYGKMSDAYENLSTLRKITDLQKKIHDEPNQHSSVESPNQEIDTLLEERKASSKELKVLSESSEGLTAKTFKAYCQKYGSLIQMIGEPLIRRKLQALYDDLFLADNERECNKNLEELTRLLNSDDEQMRKKYRDALKNLLADSSSD